MTVLGWLLPDQNHCGHELHRVDSVQIHLIKFGGQREGECILRAVIPDEASTVLLQIG